MAKYTKPLDYDDDEKGNNWKYRLPYALCKQKGIVLPDWATPRDAWNALKREGINPDDEYQKAISKFQKKVAQKRRNERLKEQRKIAKEHKKQSLDSEHSPDYDYQIAEGEIAGVKRGEPMNFEQANGGAPNPYFSKDARFGGELFGYSTNCQTCVVVFEARQRGYDVRALPNNRNPYIKDLSHGTNLAYIDEYGNYPQYIQPMVKERKKAFFERTIQEGKRYSVEWAWNERCGHIISVQREGGNIVFYDPQTTKKYSLEEFNREVAPKGHDFKVMRVDNCEFNPEYVNYIMKGAK